MDCCNSGDAHTRREFLKATGAGMMSLTAMTRAVPIMAGPFEENDYLRLIPADKKLDPVWVASLFARGEPEEYSGDGLKYIGMPVGGICAGMLYLGGDGKLWLWRIFNRQDEGVVSQDIEFQGRRVRPRDGANYVRPPLQTSPLDQGFALAYETSEGRKVRPLDRGGFENITFLGQYPVGTVTYRDPSSPVSVTLEAFSPFIPLDFANSSLPATMMSYTVKNESDGEVEAEINGWMENAVCIHSNPAGAERRSSVVRDSDMTFLLCSMERKPRERKETPRPDILFDDFEAPEYKGWESTGTAFGKGPVRIKDMPEYQGDVGGGGEYVVNSHNARQGEDVRRADEHTGTLLSKPFVIERDYINFYIGGGSHAGRTCVDLLVDGEAVRTATGRNQNRMRRACFDVAALQGKEARIRMVDDVTGGWGNIGVDEIVFSDTPRTDDPDLEELYDYGSMGLALLGAAKDDRADPLKGELGRKVKLAPGASETIVFAITWHFPNLSISGLGRVGREYAARFDSALAVARYVSRSFDFLAETTRLWRDTWYDSTLPYWLLNRSFANTSTLATTTCHRFENGRFWAWEGIGCCAGTCTHVWHYAQALGRLFPELERDLRERTDFGIAFDAKTGGIRFRGEMNDRRAADGQAGVIMRTYREHQMSPSDAFLRRNWTKVKGALRYLIHEDKNADGLLEGEQHNTLDAEWYGRIPVISSLYLCALACGETMAKEMGDGAFEKECRRILERGRKNILRLFNGEYFVQLEDPEHLDAIGVGQGCYIDQVFGQGWAHQLGLGRLFDEAKITSALRSLWKYNFTPDVGPFKERFRKGRFYALAGDGGLVMCTWPRGGKRDDWERHWQYGYFNECMSGFEYQAAGHMVWEGMVEEGLAIARAIHDRYSGKLRNPYNEVECSDHYARAMASYGVYLAACGYEYHGPKGYLGFAPRIRPEDFKAAFTAAEGWGSIAQKLEGGTQRFSIEIKHGRLALRELSLVFINGEEPRTVEVKKGTERIKARMRIAGRRVRIELGAPVLLESGDLLRVALS